LHETRVESCAGVVNEPHRSLESVSASTAAGRSARKAVNRPTEAREGVPVTDRNFSDRPDQSDQPRPRKVPSISGQHREEKEEGKVSRGCRRAFFRGCTTWDRNRPSLTGSSPVVENAKNTWANTEETKLFRDSCSTDILQLLSSPDGATPTKAATARHDEGRLGARVGSGEARWAPPRRFSRMLATARRSRWSSNRGV
jgi:hypothetical protein